MERLTYKSLCCGDYGLTDSHDKYTIWNKLGMYEDLEEQGKIRPMWRTVERNGLPPANKYNYLLVRVREYSKPLVAEFKNGEWYVDGRVLECNVIEWFPVEVIGEADHV